MCTQQQENNTDGQIVIAEKYGSLFGSPSDFHQSAYETAAGTILLCDNCSPTLVACLRADEGLRAFARRPENEHRLLLNLSQHPNAKLTLAYNLMGEIVGQVTLAPLQTWWQDCTDMYEIAFEVSSCWRRRGIARRLLTVALDSSAIEPFILVGMGLCWHWDLDGLELSPYGYREMLARLAASYGFTEYLTTEPNIIMEPANILLARIGRSVTSERTSHFYAGLVQ